MPLPSELDNAYQAMARKHINTFRTAEITGKVSNNTRVLEIGPAKDSPLAWADTLDLHPGCTYEADICDSTPISKNTYDIVVCLEVLEHTVDPFSALAEIRRILKPGGWLLASAPMNFREHGPLPDCWRFTRHGWRVLLKDWDAAQLDVLMTPDRPLMPLHINVSARCNKTKNVRAQDMTFPLEFE